jgi:hypothetical protein
MVFLTSIFKSLHPDKRGLGDTCNSNATYCTHRTNQPTDILTRISLSKLMQCNICGIQWSWLSCWFHILWARQHLFSLRRMSRGSNLLRNIANPSKGSAWPDEELRFCLLAHNVQIFRKRTWPEPFSLVPLYVSLVMDNEWELACFWPIVQYLGIYIAIHREEWDCREGGRLRSEDLRFFTSRYYD